MKVLIMMGLPASGKTTFSQLCCKQAKSKKIKNIDFDILLARSKSIEKIVYDNVSSSYDEIVVDGLFLSNESVFNVLNLIEERCKKIDNVEIHYWRPNIEYCLWNDKYRRGVHSEITIKNAILEKPNLELLNKLPNKPKIEIIYHNVERKPKWLVFADKYKLYLDEYGKMRSDSWCLGGTWCGCDGFGGNVSSEPQPESFTALDTLLEEVCPTISFLKYKKLYSNCIDTETYIDTDYYGSRTEHAYFSCNIKLLYDGLIEMGIEIDL
jgi:hypothetical protein